MLFWWAYLSPFPDFHESVCLMATVQVAQYWCCWTSCKIYSLNSILSDIRPNISNALLYGIALMFRAFINWDISSFFYHCCLQSGSIQTAYCLFATTVQTQRKTELNILVHTWYYVSHWPYKKAWCTCIAAQFVLQPLL